MFEGIIAMAKENLKNGIPVGLGTDTACPYVTQYDMWRELCYYAKFCGVSNAFALYSATLLNAELAGIGGETGSIKRGKRAEMIIVRKTRLRICGRSARRKWSSWANGSSARPGSKKSPRSKRNRISGFKKKASFGRLFLMNK